MNAARVVLGVALAFLLGSCPACLTVVATQAMSGRESATVLLLSYGASWFVLFGVGSAAGLLVAGVRGRVLRIGVLACAGGGAIAGVLIALMQAIHRLGGSPGSVLIAFAIPSLMPWMIGWLIWTVARPRA